MACRVYIWHILVLAIKLLVHEGEVSMDLLRLQTSCNFIAISSHIHLVNCHKTGIWNGALNNYFVELCFFCLQNNDNWGHCINFDITDSPFEQFYMQRAWEQCVVLVEDPYLSLLGICILDVRLSIDVMHVTKIILTLIVKLPFRHYSLETWEHYFAELENLYEITIWNR